MGMMVSSSDNMKAENRDAEGRPQHTRADANELRTKSIQLVGWFVGWSFGWMDGRLTG